MVPEVPLLCLLRLVGSSQGDMPFMPVRRVTHEDIERISRKYFASLCGGLLTKARSVLYSHLKDGARVEALMS
jgi:hypothetical protein